MPTEDLLRIKRVMNMEEVWRHLDRIYGDLALNN